MPRPWTVIRYLAAAYSGSMGAILFGVFVYETITEKGVFTGGGVRHPMDPTEASLFALWLVAVAITGWCALDAIAAEPRS